MNLNISSIGVEIPGIIDITNDDETDISGRTVDTNQVAVDYSKTGIMYPLFGLPGQTWDDMIEYRKAHPSLPWIAIINPLNGPGEPNYIFETYVEKMQDANIQVLGYVSTYWSAVPIDSVKEDIDKYKEYFGVDGIFLDEMSSRWEDVEHYREISNYSKSVGMKYIVGNTGTDAAPDYVGVVDNIVISEGYGEPELSRLAGWHVPHGRDNFSYIAYNRHTVDPQYVTTSTHFASYIYITDDYLPNPYDKMPSHFDGLLSLLDPLGQNNMRNVALKSVDLAGVPMNGTLAISQQSEIVASGGEWITRVGTMGDTYEVRASDNLEYVFAHWEDGSVSPTRTVTLGSSSIVLTAYYIARDSPMEPGITINAMTENGAELSMWTVIESGNQVIESGFTPLRFTGNEGQQYDVYLSDWQYRTFDRWMDGNSANPRTITYSGESFLTAYFKYDSPTESHDTLTINTYDEKGNILTMWTDIRTGDSINHGYTPLTIPVIRGETYTVSVADWENFTFEEWGNGIKSRSIDITINEPHENLTAYYRENAA